MALTQEGAQAKVAAPAAAAQAEEVAQAAAAQAEEAAQEKVAVLALAQDIPNASDRQPHLWHLPVPVGDPKLHMMPRYYHLPSERRMQRKGPCKLSLQNNWRPKRCAISNRSLQSQKQKKKIPRLAK